MGQWRRKWARVSGAPPHASQMGESTSLHRNRWALSAEKSVLRRARVEMMARDNEESYGGQRMRDGSELSIWRNAQPVLDRFHKVAQLSRISVFMARLQVVRETGTDGDAGSNVAACAATSANSFPTVPICAGVHTLVIWRSGYRSIAPRTRTSYAIARNWPERGAVETIPLSPACESEILSI